MFHPDNEAGASLMSENLIVKIAASSDVHFKLGNVTAPCVSALRNSQITNDILTVGRISLELAAPGISMARGIIDSNMLTAVLFDYALEVSPRIEGSENTIDVSALTAHAKWLKELCDYDEEPEMIEQIQTASQNFIRSELIKNKPADPDVDGASTSRNGQ